MRLLILALVLAAVSCAPRAVDVRPTPSPRTKIATQVVEYVNPAEWRVSGFARIGEVVAPHKIVYAGDGTVCAVMELEVKPVLVGDVYNCKTAWRVPQH